MPAVRVIVNPAAGKGAGGRQAQEIRARLAAYGIDGDLTLTEGPGHAIEMAREASLAGCKVVVAAGGDGTTNEVINGLMQAQVVCEPGGT